MREAFITKRFSPASALVVSQADTIISEYRRQGYTLSLRQLYYQFVSRDLLPNTVESYNRLGRIVSDARMSGDLDWESIEDRGRVTVANTHWTSPGQIVKAAARSFRIDRWENQPCHVEVQVEKQALEGVLIPVCQEVDVSFTANKGYSSSSATYEASKRMLRKLEEGKEVHVLYLGDHDPSGIDMTRDVRDRLSTFLRIAPVPYALYESDDADDSVYRWENANYNLEEYGDAFTVHRLALNMDQVEVYRPPENPAKMTDSRATGYVERFGYSSWELDALDPSVLGGLVRDEVQSLIDQDAWEETEAREKAMRDQLNAFAAKYEGA